VAWLYHIFSEEALGDDSIEKFDLCGSSCW